jgi:membrane protein YdbS with pleckstrin-like domain
MNASPLEYQRLGPRTLAVFLLRTSWVPLVVLVTLGILAALLMIAPASAAATIILLLWIGAGLGVIAIAGAGGAAWLAYTHYGMAVGEADFKFKHGIVSEEEIGIPYRRIKEVKIRRNAMDMMLGVSTLIITIAEEEEDPRESSIQIDALDKKLAAQFEEDILKRAEVERIQVGANKADVLQ